MNRTTQCVLMAAATSLLSTAAQADWIPADGHKMHYPQLPDPNGWDVDFTTDYIYDDWRCSSTGPVEDLHLWYSWKDDAATTITGVKLRIYSDVPAVGPDFSHPGVEQWSRQLLPTEFTSRFVSTSPQGWYSPLPTGEFEPNNHMDYFQLNIPSIVDPFIQQVDTVYWLGVQLQLQEGSNATVGWKTTVNHWNDDAVYFMGGQWHELRDPLTNVSLDMSFVITPEPAGAAALGLTALLLRRRRH